MWRRVREERGDGEALGLRERLRFPTGVPSLVVDFERRVTPFPTDVPRCVGLLRMCVVSMDHQRSIILFP